MAEQHALSTRADVAAALACEALVPPARPSTIPPGPVADLRDAMARFSGPDTHASRRADVEMALGRLDNYPFDILARDRARAVAGGEPLDALDRVGRVVPTVTLAAALGVHDHEIPAVVDDVRSVVGVIGRAEPWSPRCDEAARRLLRRFDSHEFGPVAGASLLYQNHDATAALFGSTVLGVHLGTERRCALARTIRVARDDTTILTTTGTLRVAAGETVVLDLEASGWEFGTGPHACPGQTLAQRLVAAMTGALAARGYVLDVAAVEYADDGRPRTLPMHVRRGN